MALTSIARDDSWPFRGSDAVARGLVSWTVLRGPRFRRVAPDTYVAADIPDAPTTRLRAAAVWAGPDAVLTGWSACVALEVDVLPWPAPPIELTAPGRHPRPPPGVVVRRRVVPETDVVEVDGLSATSPVRTAYDLATTVGLTDAVVAADGLGRVGTFTGADLAAVIARHPGRPGNARATTVAGLMDPRAESPPETRVRLAILRAGLPAPVPQYRVRGDDGWEIARVDLAWPQYRVALEYDGKDHALDDRRGRDLDRLENLRQAGWVVIVITARQMRLLHRVLDRVREELAARRPR